MFGENKRKEEREKEERKERGRENSGCARGRTLYEGSKNRSTPLGEGAGLLLTAFSPSKSTNLIGKRG